jgi:hypothetical protein
MYLTQYHTYLGSCRVAAELSGECLKPVILVRRSPSLLDRRNPKSNFNKCRHDLPDSRSALRLVEVIRIRTLAYG